MKKFIEYLKKTQVRFEDKKATAGFTKEQNEVIDILFFGYKKAVGLIQEEAGRLSSYLTDERGYGGSIAINQITKQFYGRILDLSDVVTYKGDTLQDLTTAFHKAVDDYLKSCAETGKTPE